MIRPSDQEPVRNVQEPAREQYGAPEPQPKGGTATVELRHPQTEAHLCQLAVLENFAEHGLYVKFSNEEAEQLEQEALALALAESAREASMLREERGVNRQPLILASTPYSKEEAERIAAELMHAERQAAHAEQQAAHVEQKGAQAGKPAVNASKPTPKPAVTFSEPVPKQSSGPAPKQSKGGGFKSLFKRKSTDKAAKQAAPKVKSNAVAQAPQATQASVEPQTPVKEPTKQQPYSNVLQTAKALKGELQFNLPQYKARNASLEKQASMLEARLQKEPPTVEAADALDVAKTQVETAEIQLDVMEEGIEELTNLERFVLKTKPPTAQAAALSGEIVHQLMACLSHVGVPTKTAHLRAAATSPAQQETTAALVAHFRAHCHLPHPLPLPADLVVEEPQTPQAALPEEAVSAAVREPAASKPALPAAPDTPLETATAPPDAREVVPKLPGLLSVAPPEASRPQHAHPTAEPPAAAPAADTEEPIGAIQKQQSEAAPLADLLVDTVTVQEKADGRQKDRKAPEPETDVSEAAPPPQPPHQQQQQQHILSKPQHEAVPVDQPNPKEPAPKKKKGFGFFKRDRQTEPQAKPLSAAAIREAEESSPPRATSKRPEASAPITLQIPPPSTSAPQQAAEPASVKAGPSAHRPVEVATSAAAIESVAAHAQASPAPEPAAEDGSASASASSQTESAAAAEVSSQPVQSSIAAAAAPRVDTVSSAGTVSAEQAPAAAEAVSAAKPLPEQDKPVPLTPRSPGTDTGSAAPLTPGRRVRMGSRLRRHMPGKGGGAGTDAKAAAERIRQNPQVESLFKELCEALPSSFMMRNLDKAAEGSPDKAAQPDLTPEQQELAEADAARHAFLIATLSKDISDFTAPNMTTLVEYARDTSARLGVIMADEETVLAQFPTWPQGKWQSLKEAADAYSELSEYARREKQWLLQRGTCDEEVRKIEAFVDRARSRTESLAAKQSAAESRWQLQGIPWDGSVYSTVRTNSLHLATLYMSRVLFEVASLEREATLPHEACLRHLAATIRTCHKIHSFAGGFEQDQSDLFDKVQRLAKYYLRVMDPAWFEESAEWGTKQA